MSDANVIYDTSRTLQKILKDRLGASEPSVTVTVDSPHKSSTDEFRVNLFLYNVVQDESRRNAGRIELLSSGKARRYAFEPLALRLYYLVTAFANDALDEHRLLGEAIAAFYANRRVPEAALLGTLQNSQVRAEHVQITQLNLDVDNLQKIWGSQTEHLRTSVAFEIEALFLEADETTTDVTTVLPREEGGGPFVGVVPFPQIQVIAPESAPAGATVRLFGSNLLLADKSELADGGLEIKGIRASSHPEKEAVYRAAVQARRKLLKIWFGGAQAQILDADQTSGAVSVIVPASLKPGFVDVQIQLEQYSGTPIPFEVLAGGAGG